MTYKHRFSIVIPTRNRPKTLRHAVATCLDQREFDDYEIVIQDNGDDDETERLIARLAAADPAAKKKLNYHRRGEVCSMSRNFEEAILRSQGEYVIVLGDDDGLVPLALRDLDRLARDTGAAVIRWANGLYTWPSLTFQDWGNYLAFSLVRCLAVENGRKGIQKALDTLSYDHLPMLYINAAVHRHVIHVVLNSEGKLFCSRSPDVYSAMTLSYFCGDFLNATVPFSLAGLSSASNGVSTAFGGDNAGPRVDFRGLNSRDGITMHPHVPNLAIFPVVDLADSFYLAKEHHFPEDAGFVLDRRKVIEASIRRSNVQAGLVRQELLRACEGDAELIQFAQALMEQQVERQPGPRLRPVNLGFDGTNLHLDGRDFGVLTIKDAVEVVHKIVWPQDAPIRYDMQSPQ